MASAADVVYAYRVNRAEQRVDALMAFPDYKPDGSDWPEVVVRSFERDLEKAVKKRDKLRLWGHTGAHQARRMRLFKPTVLWVDVA